MLIDGLPIWGFIGKVERLPGKAGDKEGGSEKLSLFTHIHFDILYNKDRVVQVDISTGEAGRWRLAAGGRGEPCCVLEGLHAARRTVLPADEQGAVGGCSM